jgi:hypothetical protein
MIGTHRWNGFVIKQNWKRLVATIRLTTTKPANRTKMWVTTTKEATRPIVKKRTVARETTRAAAVMTMNNMRTTGM